MRSKAVPLVQIRKMAEINNFEEKLLALLSPEEQKAYRNALPISWLEDNYIHKVISLYADLALPGNPERYTRINNQLAKDQFNGIYKMLLRFLTVPYVLEKAATITNTLIEGGKASTQSKGDHEFLYILQNCPDLSFECRRNTCGYIQGLIELTGAKSVRVSHLDEDPHCWKWLCHWE